MSDEITCIVCPIGCMMAVVVEDRKITVTGHQCKRGEDYARQEARDPRRTITSSVLVEGGNWPLVSVRTIEPVPKDKIAQVMIEIRKASVAAPVRLGQIIIENVSGTGVSVVATKTVLLKD